jgi:hypothetical protein
MATSTPKQVTGGHFAPDILDFIRFLTIHSVEYLIVGGEAVVFHGYPRLTGDVDFFYRRTTENVNRLFAALTEFWSGNIPGIIAADEFLEEGLIVKFGRPPQRIDLLNRIDGVSFEDAWQDRIGVEITGNAPPLCVNYASKKALLKNKRASGRPKDLDDIEHLA